MASPAPTSDSDQKPRKEPGFWKRYFAGPDPATLTPAQRWYDQFSSVPMFIVSISWLVSTFFTWSAALSPTYRREGVTISIITWGIFALDLFIRFVLDPKKRNFIKRSWPLMIALLFPPLRILLVITAVMRVARDRNALAKIVGLYAVYAVTFVVLFGALFTLMFEIDAAGANIKSFGDATWWAFVTVTTVGYGDFTPVTIGGRVIAVLIMFTGAAAVGAVTAAVASRFINASNSSSASSSSQEPQESQSSADPHPSPSIGPVPSREEPRLEDVMNYLRTMEEQVKHIAERLDQPSATRGTAGE
jgi:voltage-gated potassium channel